MSKKIFNNGQYKIPKRKHNHQTQYAPPIKIRYQIPIALDSSRVQKQLPMKNQSLQQGQSYRNINPKENIEINKNIIIKKSLIQNQEAIFYPYNMLIHQNNKFPVTSIIHTSKNKKKKQQIAKQNLNEKSQRHCRQVQQQWDNNNKKQKQLKRNYQQFYGFGYTTQSPGLIQQIIKIYNPSQQEVIEQVINKLSIQEQNQFNKTYEYEQWGVF